MLKKKILAVFIAVTMIVPILSGIQVSAINPDYEITGAGLLLGNSLGLIVQTNIEESAPIVTTTLNGRSEKLYPHYNEDGAYYDFTGISPEEASMTITIQADDLIENITLLNAIRSLLNTDGLSEQTYRLASDLLYYVDASSQYKIGSNVLSLGTGDNFMPRVIESPEDTDKAVTASTSSDCYLTGVGYYYSNYNYLRINFATDDIEKTSVVIDGLEIVKFNEDGNGGYFVYSKAIPARYLNNPINVRLTYDGTTVQTLTYSTKAYSYAVMNNPSATESDKYAAWSLYHYGKSAAEYVESVNQSGGNGDQGGNDPGDIIVPIGFTGFIDGYFYREGELATENVDSGFEFIDGEFYKDGNKYSGFFENLKFEDGLCDGLDYEVNYNVLLHVYEYAPKGSLPDSYRRIDGGNPDSGPESPGGSGPESPGGSGPESPGGSLIHTPEPPSDAPKYPVPVDSPGTGEVVDDDGMHYTVGKMTIKEFIENVVYTAQSISWNEDNIRFTNPEGYTCYLVGGYSDFKLERALNNGILIDSDREYTLVKITRSIEIEYNPHLKLYIYNDTVTNQGEIVVYTEYLNDDALNAYGSAGITGMTLNEALEQIISIGKETGFLNDEISDITIIDTQSNASTSQTATQTAIETAITSVGINVSVNVSGSDTAPATPLQGGTTGSSLSQNQPTVAAENQSYNLNDPGVAHDDQGLIYIPISTGGYSVKAGALTTTDIVIPSTVNNIPVVSIVQNGFKGSNITSITIPGSVKRINSFAFSGCYLLEQVNFEAQGLEVISSYAFQGCETLTEISIPNSVTEISSGAFEGCWHLETISLPNTLSSINRCVFKGCFSLRQITGITEITNVGEQAFKGCEDLTQIPLNEGARIGKEAFYYCMSLNIPIKITQGTIFSGTFYACLHIQSITLTSDVNTIEENAFTSCQALNTVYFIGGKSQADSINVAAGNEYYLSAHFEYSVDEDPDAIRITFKDVHIGDESSIESGNLPPKTQNLVSIVVQTLRSNGIQVDYDVELDFENNANIAFEFADILVDDTTVPIYINTNQSLVIDAHKGDLVSSLIGEYNLDVLGVPYCKVTLFEDANGYLQSQTTYYTYDDQFDESSIAHPIELYTDEPEFVYKGDIIDSNFELLSVNEELSDDTDYFIAKSEHFGPISNFSLSEEDTVALLAIDDSNTTVDVHYWGKEISVLNQEMIAYLLGNPDLTVSINCVGDHFSVESFMDSGLTLGQHGDILSLPIIKFNDNDWIYLFLSNEFVAILDPTTVGTPTPMYMTVMNTPVTQMIVAAPYVESLTIPSFIDILDGGILQYCPSLSEIKYKGSIYHTVEGIAYSIAVHHPDVSNDFYSSLQNTSLTPPSTSSYIITALVRSNDTYYVYGNMEVAECYAPHAQSLVYSGTVENIPQELTYGTRFILANGYVCELTSNIYGSNPLDLMWSADAYVRGMYDYPELSFSGMYDYPILYLVYDYLLTCRYIRIPSHIKYIRIDERDDLEAIIYENHYYYVDEDLEQLFNALEEDGIAYDILGTAKV